MEALIVEDEDDVRELLADGLEGMGCSLQRAETRAVGPELVRLTVPDIIVVDVMMPMMNGFELVARLRENPETEAGPVILVTGVNARGSHQQARALGIRHHITKPWEPWALEIAPREAIEDEGCSPDRVSVHETYQVYPPVWPSGLIRESSEKRGSRARATFLQVRPNRKAALQPGDARVGPRRRPDSSCYISPRAPIEQCQGWNNEAFSPLIWPS